MDSRTDKMEDKQSTASDEIHKRAEAVTGLLTLESEEMSGSELEEIVELETLPPKRSVASIPIKHM